MARFGPRAKWRHRVRSRASRALGGAAAGCLALARAGCPTLLGRALGVLRGADPRREAGVAGRAAAAGAAAGRAGGGGALVVDEEVDGLAGGEGGPAGT